MDWIKHIVEFIKLMDDPSRATIGVFVLVLFAACAFFTRGSSAKVKLIAFFTIVAFAIATVIIVHHFAHEKANQQAQPSPSPSPQPVPSSAPRLQGNLFRSSSLPSSLMVAFAALAPRNQVDPRQQTQASPAQTGWIYCGKYDAARNKWGTPQNTVVERPPNRLLPRRGDQLKTLVAVDLYDAKPRFTVFGLKWQLGKKIATIPKGSLLEAVTDSVRAGDNVWCQIKRR